MPGKTVLSHVWSISGLLKPEFVLVEKVWYYSWILFIWPSYMSRLFWPAHDSRSRAKLWLSPLSQVFISQHRDTLCAKTCITLNTAIINDKRKHQIQGLRPAAWMIFTMWSDTISGFVQKLLEILWKQEALLAFQFLCILYNLKI